MTVAFAESLVFVLTNKVRFTNVPKRAGELNAERIADLSIEHLDAYAVILLDERDKCNKKKSFRSNAKFTDSELRAIELAQAKFDYVIGMLDIKERKQNAANLAAAQKASNAEHNEVVAEALHKRKVKDMSKLSEKELINSFK